MTACRPPSVDTRLKRLDGMLTGDRPLSSVERKCIQRQVEDLEAGHERGLTWKENEAVRAVEFAKLLRHWKGKQFRGKPFIPEPWQEELIIAPLFGWFRESESSKGLVRRFNEGYVEVPRKNGKSFLSAAIANQGLLADGEEAPEVYSAASMKEQAGIVYQDCKKTLETSPLAGRCRFLSNRIETKFNNGILRPLGSDYNFLQGWNPYRVVVDELHAHRKRDTYDAIITGMGSRVNWLLLSITTAGHDRSSICYDRHQYAERILDGHLEDENFFTFIACADLEDDFADPMIWWKANPNLGVSIFRDYFATRSKSAKSSSSEENTFRRLHLNQWTEQAVRWLRMEEWDRCQRDFTEAEFYGRDCIAAIDLANTRDVNALVLLFPGENEHHLLQWFWIPEESANKYQASDKRYVMAYANQGCLNLTPGNTSDFDATIPRDIFEILKKFNVLDIAFDPWGPAYPVMQRLVSMGIAEEKFVDYRQTISNFAAPTKEFERLVAQEKMLHDGNPLMRFMASCVTVKEDPAGNIRPDKSSSSAKIDGIVAAIMALGQWQTREDNTSIYETRGMRSL